MIGIRKLLDQQEQATKGAKARYSGALKLLADISGPSSCLSSTVS
jgi:hypothetical protein